jgi:recombination protein RecT
MNKNKVIKDIVLSVESELAKAIPRHMDSTRLIRCVLTQLRLNPKLAQCTWQSVVGALFAMGQVGLEPIGGQAYMVPFAGECVLIIGYQGYKELFYRHQLAVSLSMETVYEEDDFTYSYGTNPYLSHVPKGKSETPTNHYALVQLRGGGTSFVVWTHEKCIEHGKKYSKSFNSKTSPWQTYPNSMCRKTVLLQLSKRIPLSFEIRRAIEADESIRNYMPGTQDFMELPDTAWDNEIGIEESKPFPEGPPLKSESKPEPETKKNKKPPTDEEKEAIMDEIINRLGQKADGFLYTIKIKCTDDIKSREQFDGIKAALAEFMEKRGI